MRTSAAVLTAVRHSPTALQVESWRLLWDELAGDAEAAAELRAWSRRRERALPHARDLLARFVAGDVGVERFREALDRASRGEWGPFGLGGAAGAMFLNELVKRFGADPVLELALRRVLRTPPDERAALDQLARFQQALDGLAARGTLPSLARRASGSRAAFFASAWWAVALPDEWPAFHPSARSALRREEGLWSPGGNAAQDYLAFRATFLALASAANLATWELEYLCWWHERRSRSSAPRSGLSRTRYPSATPSPRRVRETAPAPTHDEPLSHTHVQWLLATLGARLGCRVWIAANDRRRRWNGEPLASLSVDRLPSLGMDAASQRLVGLIDVVWLKGANQVAAAFEVERTTSVYSGLLRMADLAALAPNLNFPLYVVAPETRLEKVRRELARPAFRALDLPRRCAFFSGEALLAAFDGILQWGSGANAIERLAQRVSLDDAD